MRELYRQIQSCNPNMEHFLLTVLDSPWMGEKMLISGGKILFSGTEHGFLAGCPELASIHKTGITEIDGIRVYCEQIAFTKKIVICGAGHVGIAVGRMASMIGLDVTIIDDRTIYADRARPYGLHVICDRFDDALDRIAGDQNTFFVIATRGHKWDGICLERIVGKQHAYIGMMGSHRRVRMVIQKLIETGSDPEVLEKVHTPVGLSIGAETPEEIAVSILAEIIEVKNASGRYGDFSREIMNAILGDHHEEEDSAEKILMTIVSRRGSAPREVGSKMVLFGDGITAAGTIGGGFVEAEALKCAGRMLQSQDSRAELIHVNMTAEEAEEEGMVCGGEVEILLEKI